MEKKKQSTAAPGRITGAYLHGLGRHVRLVSGAGRALFGRYLTLLLLVLAGLNHAAAQGHKHYVYLPDESIIMDVIPNGSTVTPLFTDPAIDMLFEGHTVYAFHKAFPTSEAGRCERSTCWNVRTPY